MGGPSDLLGICILTDERRLKKYIQKALETVFKNQPILSKFLPFHKILIDVEPPREHDGNTLGYIQSYPLHKGLSKNRVNNDVDFHIILCRGAWRHLSEYHRYKLVAHEFGHFAEMYLHGNGNHDERWKKWARWFGDDNPRAIEWDVKF